MNPLHIFLAQWMGALAGASVQVTLLIVAVVVANMLLRRSRPVVRYVLWSVVVLRLCLPFGFTSPLGIAGLSPWSHRAIFSKAEVAHNSVAPQRDAGLPAESVLPGPNGEAASPAASSGWFKLGLTFWDCCGIVWLLGTAILGVYIFRQWSRLQRIVDASRPCHRSELIALLDALRGRLGIARPVGLKMLPPGADSLGPCAAGWRRPHILLPARLAETWDLATIEPILIHELAHIRRGDVLINAVQVLVQLIYWFHPLVWLANARLRRERELICDDFAVLHSGATSRRYGASILRAIEEVRMESGWSLAGVGMGESGLSQRLRRLLDGGYSLPRPVNRMAIGTVFFAGAVGVLVASDAPRKQSAVGSPEKSRQAVAALDVAVGDEGAKLAQNVSGEKKAGVTTDVPKPAAGAVVTKVWKIPAKLLPSTPAGLIDPSTSTGDAGVARAWLVENGIVFQGNALAAYDRRTSQLTVRNTQAQIDLIDALLAMKIAPEAPAPAGAADPVIPKLELVEVTPAEALKAITAATGIKIFYTPALPGGEDVRVTLSLSDVPAMEALRYVTSLANLKFTSQKDGVHVSAK